MITARAVPIDQVGVRETSCADMQTIVVELPPRAWHLEGHEEDVSMTPGRLHRVRAIGEPHDAVVAEMDHDVRGKPAPPPPVQDPSRRGGELARDDRVHDPEATRVELSFGTEHHGVSDAQPTSLDRPDRTRRHEGAGGQ